MLDQASSSLARTCGVLGDFRTLRHNATIDTCRLDELAAGGRCTPGRPAAPLNHLDLLDPVPHYGLWMN